MKTNLIKFTYSLAFVGMALTASAQSFYPLIDTNSFPTGSGYTSIDVGNTYANGITGTFTTLNNGGMHISVYGPNTFAANINGAAVFNNQASDSLVVTFSASVTEFFLNFVADGTTGSTTMNVSAYLNSSLVGTGSYGSSNPVQWDEGQINYFNSGGFDSLVISLGNAPSFANLWAVGTDAAGTGGFGGSPAPTPEPSTMVLASLGGLGLLWQFRRR